MPEFVNPFTGVVPGRKMTDTELLRALRLNLSAEEEAIHLYLAHADATDNELARKVLKDIADEERVHKGEFQRLISILAGDEDALLAEGAQEVNDVAAGAQPNRGIGDQNPEAAGQSFGPPSQRAIPTIGDLRSAKRGT